MACSFSFDGRTALIGWIAGVVCGFETIAEEEVFVVPVAEGEVVDPLGVATGAESGSLSVFDELLAGMADLEG